MLSLVGGVSLWVGLIDLIHMHDPRESYMWPVALIIQPANDVMFNCSNQEARLINFIEHSKHNNFLCPLRLVPFGFQFLRQLNF